MMDVIDGLIHGGGLTALLWTFFGAISMSALCGLLSFATSEKQLQQRCRAVAGALCAVGIVTMAIAGCLLSLLIGTAVQSLYFLVGGVLISVFLVVLGTLWLVSSVSRFN